MGLQWSASSFYSMKTTLVKVQDVTRKWHRINAADYTLGRLCSRVAKVLAGRHKIDYTPSVDMGDFVVIINAAKIKLSGRKLDQKKYTRYSGYPGGITTTSMRTMFENTPDRIFQEAIRGMLPKTKHAKSMLRRLRIVKDDQHKFQIDQDIK